jgi:phosphotransferase system enzyme I (PtsI)
MNNKFSGIGSSNGISIAKVFKYVENDIKINNSKISNSNIEIQKIKDAIKLTIEKIQKIKENALKNLGFEKASIFDAHIQIANDIAIFNDIKKIIENEKYNVLYATNLVFKKYIKMFQSMEDPYMQERATDVKDVLNKIIHLLAGVEEVDLSSINEEVIIVAYDLTPSDTVQLNKKYVKGFLTNIGGKTSHAAILARSLEIPAILGLGNVTKLIKKNDLISMNGETGEIIINPSKKEINELKQKQKLIEEQKNENLNFKGKKTFTNDGHQVELAANIGSLNDLPQVIKNDAEAIGLLRSEFLYMDAND